LIYCDLLFFTDSINCVYLLGAYSIEIPKSIMRLGKAKNSHDTVQYATNGWATYALYDYEESNRDIQKYYDIKLKLFSIISELQSGSMNLDNLQNLRTRALDILIEHAALFPPSECTYALHEIVHVIEQIEQIGPPRYSTMFMYERVNLTLKRMVKNKNHPFASMINSYATAEFVTQSIGYNFTKMLSVMKLFSFIPTDVNLIKKVLSSFQNLYVDKANTIYCLPNLRVNALKGRIRAQPLSVKDQSELSKALGNIASDGSVLGKYFTVIYCYLLLFTVIY
jgi:hypothetical protein